MKKNPRLFKKSPSTGIQFGMKWTLLSLFSCTLMILPLKSRGADALEELMKKYGDSSEKPAEAKPDEKTKEEKAKADKPNSATTSTPAKKEAEVKETSKEESSPAEAVKEATTEKASKETISPPEAQAKEAKTEEKTASSVPSDKKKANRLYSIQIASYGQLKFAEERAQDLHNLGFKAAIKEAVVNGKSWYRVHIGTFTSRQEANEFVRSKLSGPVRAAAVVVKARPGEFSEKSVKLIEKPTQEPVPTPGPPTTSAKFTSDSSPAQEKKKETEEEEAPSYGLLGDWAGMKPFLSNHGADLQLKYRGDYVENFRGGVEKKGVSLGDVDVIADLDFEKMFGASGLHLFLYGLGTHGGHPTEFVGDTFATSNIEAPETFKLYEAYLKMDFDEHFSLLLGLHDLNVDYYALETSGYLVNSAFGISPTLAKSTDTGPSIFPTTALSVNAKYQSPSSFYFQTGLFNATAGDPGGSKGTYVTSTPDNGYLSIAELGFAGGKNEHRYKYGVGAWSYSKLKAATDTNLGDVQNSGAYILLDRNLSKNLSAFIKYGVASPRVNQFSTGFDVGVSYLGPIPGRPEDRITLGYTRAGVSDDYKTVNESKGEESVTELSYIIHVTDGLNLIPDFQYVKNPGLANDVEDAQVGTLRLDIQF